MSSLEVAETIDVGEQAQLETSDAVLSVIDPSQSHSRFGTRLRALFVGAMIASGAMTFTGCGAENKPQEDGIVVCNGKAISFDQLDGRIAKVEALRTTLANVQTSQKSVVTGVDSEGPEWVTKNPEKIKELMSAIRNADEHLANALADEATFKPLQDQLQELSKVTRDLNATPQEQLTGQMVKSGTWRTALDGAANQSAAISKTFDESLGVLSPIAIRALSHETGSMLGEFMVEFKESGRDWFKNVERYNDLLTRIDRTTDMFGRYESKSELKDQLEQLKESRVSLIQLRQTLANPANFDVDSGCSFDSGNPAMVSATRDKMISLDHALKQFVDRSNPDIQKMPVEENQRRNQAHGGSGGGGSHSFIFFHMGSSYSSSPSAFGGGRSSFSAPVARGGFGGSGAHAAFGG